MTSILQETWDKLSLPSGVNLTARQALPEVTPRLLCAIDAMGGRHLLITLNDADVEYIDRKSRGISVTTRDLAIHGNNQERYLDIACLDVSGYPILDLMGGEIARNLTDQTRQTVDIVRRILEKWRRFWGQLPQPMMSFEEQLGLFAELLFYSQWLSPRYGPEVIMVWRGPWGSRHDFEWTNKSVEVKATTNTRGRIHKIHGLSQLESPENGPLFLFSLTLREEHGATYNLPNIIEICRDQLKNAAEELNFFENSLVHIGYSPFFEEEYSKNNLRVVEANLFQVKDDFPRLTKLDILPRISEGIERVDYEINLNTYNHLIVAKQPNQIQLP
jgi:hypothetical protein